MFYRHFVLLSYETSEQLNRHAKRLIDTEGFSSAGPQGEGFYGFTKDVSESAFEALIHFGREKRQYGRLLEAREKRIAW